MEEKNIDLTDVKYSVLMSVYYKEKPEWLEYSINSMLNQTIKPDEFVIVEDGPLTDELYNVIQNFKNSFPNVFNIVKLEKNVGLGLALREGILNCKNDIIARMDSDDYAKPERIEKQLKVLDENPKIGIIGTNVIEFENTIENAISKVVLPEKHEDIYKFSKKRCPFRHPSILYKKEEVIKAGNYQDCYLCEDYDIYIRMISNGTKCFNIQEFLVYMRIGPDFYKRRGGWKYMKTILKFKTKQLKTGYFSLWDYLKSVIPHIAISIAPNFVRDYFYRKFLRKKAK